MCLAIDHNARAAVREEEVFGSIDFCLLREIILMPLRSESHRIEETWRKKDMAKMVMEVVVESELHEMYPSAYYTVCATMRQEMPKQNMQI